MRLESPGSTDRPDPIGSSVTTIAVRDGELLPVPKRSDRDVDSLGLRSALGRRGFLKLLSVGGAIAGVSSERSLRWNSALAAEVIQDADVATMYDPGRTGLLRHEQKDTLWTIFSHIGERWQNETFNNLTRAEFDRMLDLKTSRRPSYYTEYTSAVSFLDELSSRTGNTGSAVEKLFDDGYGDGDLQRHAYSYVVSEFIRLHVACGGFRKWGYLNYRGYAGGSFSNPYRV